MVYVEEVDDGHDSFSQRGVSMWLEDVDVVVESWFDKKNNSVSTYDTNTNTHRLDVYDRSMNERTNDVVCLWHMMSM